MNILLLHVPTPTGPHKQIAVNADEILRMEEVEGGMTQIIQQDKGPTTVEEKLADVLKALGEEVKEVKPEPKEEEAGLRTGSPKHGQPIHSRTGGK